VYWESKKIKLNAISTAECEYVSMAHGIQYGIYIKQVLMDMPKVLSQSIVLPITTKEDNTAAIAMSKPFGAKNCRTKHIDIKYHFIRDRVLQGHVTIQYIPSQNQLGDMLTKPLDAISHQNLMTKIGIY